jgi:hypothetical protein
MQRASFIRLHYRDCNQETFQNSQALSDDPPLFITTIADSLTKIHPLKSNEHLIMAFMKPPSMKNIRTNSTDGLAQSGLVPA